MRFTDLFRSLIALDMRGALRVDDPVRMEAEELLESAIASSGSLWEYVHDFEAALADVRDDYSARTDVEYIFEALEERVIRHGLKGLNEVEIGVLALNPRAICGFNEFAYEWLLKDDVSPRWFELLKGPAMRRNRLNAARDELELVQDRRTLSKRDYVALSKWVEGRIESYADYFHLPIREHYRYSIAFSPGLLGGVANGRHAEGIFTVQPELAFKRRYLELPDELRVQLVVEGETQPDRKRQLGRLFRDGRVVYRESILDHPEVVAAYDELQQSVSELLTSTKPEAQQAARGLGLNRLGLAARIDGHDLVMRGFDKTPIGYQIRYGLPDEVLTMVYAGQWLRHEFKMGVVKDLSECSYRAVLAEPSFDTCLHIDLRSLGLGKPPAARQNWYLPGSERPRAMVTSSEATIRGAVSVVPPGDLDLVGRS